jgi:DNA polymerase III epsilon subunit-like protein
MTTTWFSVDIEADGPHPDKYSMLSIGVVRVDSELKTTFYAELRPTTPSSVTEAMEVNGLDRYKLEREGEFFHIAMTRLVEWLYTHSNGSRPVMVSDNPLFDGQFINYYFWNAIGENPFGHSAKRIGDMWLGIQSLFEKLNLGKLSHKDWHELRKTPHTHNALDDAMGNAEAILEMHSLYGLKVPGL